MKYQLLESVVYGKWDSMYETCYPADNLVYYRLFVYDVWCLVYDVCYRLFDMGEVIGLGNDFVSDKLRSVVYS